MKRVKRATLLGPSLVGVVVRAFPDLDDVAVGLAAVGEIEALALVFERNAVVVGVVPGLLRETGVALPDLHLSAVARGCSVEYDECVNEAGKESRETYRYRRPSSSWCPQPGQQSRQG